MMRMLALLIALVGLAAPVGAQPLTSSLPIGLCLGVIAEATGRPAWQLVYLDRDLVLACEQDPYHTMTKVKGVGNVLVPLEELRRRAPLAPASR